jgi:MYXO-CTERM domain-containing protein
MCRTRLLLCALAACAAPVSTTTTEQAITNGAIDTGDPAVLALVDDMNRVGCTVSVIGPHTAITAAHCFVDKQPRSLRVFFGSAIADGGTFTQVADARSHPQFDPSTFAHDVAMLTFRDALPVSPLTLDARTIDTFLVGTSFRVVGFGTTSGTTGDSGTKRDGTARVSDVQAEEFTAMPNPSQPCRGDSGGPALLSPGAIAGVVSRGDLACADHATYARIDVARALLVDPYLADTSPGTAHTGDACFYAGHCAEGDCLQTGDDPRLHFCSQPCSGDDECPSAMECASDGCRYPEPSPGALGSSCDQDARCTTGVCQQGVCTLSCLLDPSVCPDGFDCERLGAMQFCFAERDSCGGCTSGSSPAPLWLIVLYFARGRRRRTSPTRPEVSSEVT